ncbi:MAG: glycosyltransferase [Candidatus Riflebacteria bacterium]|nr:glycosyltransferase [Candidatus Riflebacteria bacterium]
MSHNPSRERKQLDLTVVVPTRNAIRTLRPTLESLRPLREAGARVIVVDSDSTDGTPETARQMADLILDCPPGNMYAAVNFGLRRASTGWLGYLNADDLVFAETLATALSQAGEDAALLYGDLDYIDREGRFVHAVSMPPPGDILPLAALGISAVSPIGTVFRRQVFEALGGFDERWRLAGDFDFFARAGLQGFAFRKIGGGSVGAFRLHASQFSVKALGSIHDEVGRIVAARSWPVSRARSRWARWMMGLRNLPSYLIRWWRSHARGGSLGRLPDCLDDGDPRSGGR